MFLDALFSPPNSTPGGISGDSGATVRGCLLTKTIARVMKLTAIILLVGCLQVSAGSYSQITLVEKNTPLEKVLKKIEKQSGYVFFFDKAFVREAGLISIKTKNAPLNLVLEECFRHQSSTYTIIGRTIVIKKKPRTAITGVANTDSTTAPPITIKGTVRNENGEPLAGVTVTVAGGNRRALTDANGEFTIEGLTESPTLEFSYIGYTTQVVQGKDQSSMRIILRRNNFSMNEVVVVGYGTVNKSDLTGAVSKVSENNIKATPIVDLDRAMQGRAAGVLVTQNSARPGGDATIRVRGTGSVNAGNSPLYVIDGFPTDNINSINPGDIESIEILKDASSTAIYGSRGSNGVIMVTTKRGKSGQSSINFESYYGIQSIRRKIPLLNAKQYAEFINEARINGGGTPYFDGSADDKPLPSALGEGTDWQDQVFRSAPLQQYQLSILGGESKTRYALSGNIYDQQGIIKNSYFKRYTLRANLDRDISSRISIGMSMQGAFTKSNAARTETDGGGNSGVTNAGINFAPTFPVYNNEGKYYRDQGPLNGNLVDNPLGLANEITDQTYTTRILTNVFADIKIMRGLSFRTSWGADLFHSKNNYYATRQIGLGAGLNGDGAVTAGQTINWLNENTLTYTEQFGGQHKLTALVGYTSQGYKHESVYAAASNFNDDFAEFNNLGAGATLRTPSTNARDWGLISYLARVNYGYSDRFLLTLTARRDGSSRFGPNNKYGFFPSGAVAWRVINEKFMKNQQLFSDLKIRGSYGLTGNQEIGDYGYLSFIANVRYPFGGANPVMLVGGVPGGISNLNLSWEKNAQFDGGIDVGVLNNRIQLTADYYIKTTSDLLFSVNVPQTTGYSSSLQNIGQVQNRGLELGLNTININGKHLQWRTEFNIAFNKNKVLRLDGRPEFTTGAGSGHLGVFNTVLMKVGEPLGNFYGRKVIGIFQDEKEVEASAQPNAMPGDLRYADLNSDGEINDLDRTVIGNGNPEFFGGLNNTISYRGFELNIFFQGSYGNDILNIGRFDLYNLNGNNNQSADVLNRWTATNRSTNIPRANATGGQRILSSFHIEDGSYVRMKNLSLGYQFPADMMGSLPIKGVKVYLSLQNWLTVTSYKGYDPEVSRFGNTSFNQGMDYGAYPASKTVLFGLNVKF